MKIDIKAEFKALLQATVDETGFELKRSADELSDYTAERAEHLATIAHEPGFDLALKAERDAVALFAGIEFAGQLDHADGQILGLVTGFLHIAAKVLAAA